MRLINFTFYSSIELGIEGRPRYLDLHNIYGWQSVTYLSQHQRIRMSWALPTGGGIQPNLPPVVVLEFRGVSGFAARPRDSEVPYTEDSCLEAVTFTPPERASDFCFEREFEGYRSNSEHITFMFRSGFGLKIWAEEVELSYS